MMCRIISPVVCGSEPTRYPPRTKICAKGTKGGALGCTMISLKYDWEHEYIAAVLETDNAVLPERISTAELAIAKRVDALNMNHGGTPEEQQSLAAALAGLNKLRVERLGQGR